MKPPTYRDLLETTIRVEEILLLHLELREDHPSEVLVSNKVVFEDEGQVDLLNQ